MARMRWTILFLTLTLSANASAQVSANKTDPSSRILTLDEIAHATPPPRNPADTLDLALTMNGLAMPSAKPWHVKLSYDEFDEDGDNVRSGTFEEYYVGPKKYRVSYAGDTFTQTDIATDSGLYRIGDQRWPSPVELQVRNEALTPLYRATRNARNTRPEKTEWLIGTTKLPCMILRRTDLIISDNGLIKFCFDRDTVLLRYTRGRGWDETTYNNIVLFQGRYVARDVVVTQGGHLFLKIRIEDLETTSQIDETLFAPPGRSGPLSGRVAISSDVLMDEYLLEPGQLLRPRTATGKVIVKFVVGKDGRVIEANASEGPSELRKAALAAMRGYKFRPFLILDRAVEVESEMFFEVR